MSQEKYYAKKLPTDSHRLQSFLPLHVIDVAAAEQSC